MAWKEDIDDVDWSYTHDYVFFACSGEEGGKSRSPKKLAAKRNLEKANAARKVKAEERRRLRAAQVQAPHENSGGFQPKG